MSDATPAPAPPAATAPQKHVSGFLVFSLMLSVGGLFFRPLLGIGPLIGIGLALVGRKKAKADPMVIGPRLAIWCLAIAIASLGLQGWQIYRIFPVQAFWQSVGTSQHEFIETLRAGDYDRLLEIMDPDEGAHPDAESLEAALGGVFGADESVELGEAVLREDAFDKQRFQKEGEAFMRESEGEFRFTLPIRIPLEGRNLDLDFDMRVRREGFAAFTAWVRDMRPVESTAEEKPAEEAAPTEEGAEETPPDEKTGD